LIENFKKNYHLFFIEKYLLMNFFICSRNYFENVLSTVLNTVGWVKDAIYLLSISATKAASATGAATASGIAT
jgi:hypothetical protein